jgi:hypothetical protein
MVGDDQSLGGRRGVPRRVKVGQGRAVGRDDPVRASENSSWLGAAAHRALAIAAPVPVVAAAAAASVACHRGIGGTCKGYGQFTTPQQIQFPVAAAGASPSTARSKMREASSGDVVAIWIADTADLTSWRDPTTTITTTTLLRNYSILSPPTGRREDCKI